MIHAGQAEHFHARMITFNGLHQRRQRGLPFVADDDDAEGGRFGEGVRGWLRSATSIAKRRLRARCVQISLDRDKYLPPGRNISDITTDSRCLILASARHESTDFATNV